MSIRGRRIRGRSIGWGTGRGGEHRLGEEDGPGADLGGWLADRRRRLDAGEAAWLSTLARFDAEGGWAGDGQLSCVDWLVCRARMSRASAYEKLRAAHELGRRPVLAHALATGRASYCAIRAMCRAPDTTAEVDESFVAVAAAGTVADVEAVVAAYLLYACQDRPPPPPLSRRGLRIIPLGDGMTRIEAIVTDLEAAELEVALRAHLDHHPASGHPAGDDRAGDDRAGDDRAGDDLPGHGAVDESTPVDGSPGAADRGAAGGTAEHPGSGGGAVDESTRVDGSPVAVDRRSWPAIRADALMALARVGLGTPYAVGADRYLVHVVVRHPDRSQSQGALLGGAVLHPWRLAEVGCDCSTVVHHHDARGVPLDLGRRSRTWSTTQRRAISVRDGGRCRWPGCHRSQVDIHHLRPWSEGGATDIANGLCLCPRHHSRLHSGFTATGDANATLRFHRPDGTVIPG